jgi:hypothetical protein
MNDSIRHRDGPHQNSTAGHGNPRWVTTWARALAAAVLLDPAALRRTPPTTTGRRLAAPGLAALAVVDVAAAALIECGYDESAFLLLALADPTPRTPNPRTPAARTPSVPRRPTSRLLRRTGGGSAGDSTDGRPWGAGT